MPNHVNLVSFLFLVLMIICIIGINFQNNWYQIKEREKRDKEKKKEKSCYSRATNKKKNTSAIGLPKVSFKVQVEAEMRLKLWLCPKNKTRWLIGILSALFNQTRRETKKLILFKEKDRVMPKISFCTQPMKQGKREAEARHKIA